MKLLLLGLILPVAWGFLLPNELTPLDDSLDDHEEIGPQTDPKDQPQIGQDQSQLQHVAKIESIVDWYMLLNLLDQINEEFNSHLVIRNKVDPLGLRMM